MGASMSRKSRVQEAIDRAASDANRTIVATAVAELPANTTTIKELHQAMAKSPFGSAFENMTLAELRDALGATPTPRSSAPKRSNTQPRVAKKTARKINTRTAAGRAALDTAVLDFLRENGASRSEAITPSVPGDTAQVRQALKRMIETGDVVVKGNRRASEYSLTKKAK